MSMTESKREEIISDIRDGYIDEWDNLTIKELFKQIENEHKEIQQYRAIGTVSEFRENKNFLEFLYNHIQPNEMEQYLAMYHASGKKGE